MKTRGQWILVFSMLAAGCASEPGELRFGTMLLQTVLLLAGVCGLALVTLRLAARAGLGGRQRRPDARMEVLEEIGVGPRQSVLALRAGSKVWLVGRTQTGLSGLGEMSESEWQSAAAQANRQPDDDGVDPRPGAPSKSPLSFAQVLADARAVAPPDPLDPLDGPDDGSHTGKSPLESSAVSDPNEVIL